MRAPELGSTTCTRKGCGGVLMNTTPRLAQFLGQLHVECDRCHAKWCFRVTGVSHKRRTRKR